MLGPKKVLGSLGEEVACQYLRRQGYEVIGRNFRKRAGEVDLVAVKDEFLIVVEVKTRHAPVAIDPIFSLTAQKKNRMAKLAEIYLFQDDRLRECQIRFDLIVVEQREAEYAITHWPDAFQCDGDVFSSSFH